MNTPNKITFSRIILTFVLIILLVFPWYAVGVQWPKFLVGGLYVNSLYIIAGVIFMIAAVTDFLDGYLARKNNQVTDLGKMLDAIADKILVNPILIILATNGFINPVVPVVIITRDIIVDAIKMESARKGKVQAAIGSGKLKTASLLVGIVLTFFYNIPFEFINIRVSDFLLYFATAMSVLSAIEYFKLNKSVIFPKKEIETHGEVL